MKRKITLLVLALMAIFQFVNAQNILTVDNTPGSNAQFSDLQSAIASATSGDVIYIQPSETSYGDILVDKPLTFLGFGHSGEKETLIEDIRFTEAASNCTFRGLHVTNSFRVQLDDRTLTLTNFVLENNIFDRDISFLYGGVDNMVIRGNVIWTLGAPTTSSSSNSYSNTIIANNILVNYVRVKNHQTVTLKNNIFLSSSQAPIGNMASDTGILTAQNNIFYSSSSANIDKNSTGVLHENSLIYNSGSGSALALNGPNNIANLDPMFVSTNDNDDFEAMLDDYHLLPGSPAIAAGVSGEDIGLYGGGDFVFNNFGLTSDIPTVRIDAITNTVTPNENINVTISTNAQ